MSWRPVFFAGTNHSPRGLSLEGQTLPDRHYDRFLATAGQKSLRTNMARQVVVYVLSFNAASLPFPLFHKLSLRTRRFICCRRFKTGRVVGTRVEFTLVVMDSHRRLRTLAVSLVGSGSAGVQPERPSLPPVEARPHPSQATAAGYIFRGHPSTAAPSDKLRGLGGSAPNVYPQIMKKTRSPAACRWILSVRF